MKRILSRADGTRPTTSQRYAERVLRATRAVDLAYKAFDVVREELALALLDRAQQAALTARLYRGKVRYTAGSPHNAVGLFQFERDAIERFFPPPPARIVVGGCGGGREVLALLQAGYQVVAAYDPASNLVAGLRERLGEAGELSLWVGSHETFGCNVPARFAADAVLVGWGSFTHVMGRQQRVAFLRSVRRVCPYGPVALSYFSSAEPQAGGRRRVRAWVRRGLGIIPGILPRLGESGDGFEPQTGFSHWFAPGELEREAQAAGYRLALCAEDGPDYAHAVLLPDV